MAKMKLQNNTTVRECHAAGRELAEILNDNPYRMIRATVHDCALLVRCFVLSQKHGANMFDPAHASRLYVDNGGAYCEALEILRAWYVA